MWHLHEIGKEVGVRVAVVRPGPVGLEVDVVPGDTVGLARGHGGAHCEEQPLLPRQVEPVQSPVDRVKTQSKGAISQNLSPSGLSGR